MSNAGLVETLFSVLCSWRMSLYIFPDGQRITISETIKYILPVWNEPLFVVEKNQACLIYIHMPKREMTVSNGKMNIWNSNIYKLLAVAPLTDELCFIPPSLNRQNKESLLTADTNINKTP